MNYPLGRSFEEASLARAESRTPPGGAANREPAAGRAETIRQAGAQIRSTAERVDAARAGATLAEQRVDAEQRRYDVGLSTTFLVTQAQRDLLQAQVNLLQTTLDYESSLVNFEAVQLAPAVSGSAVRVNGSTIVSLPAPSPRGVFRSAAGVQP